MDEQKRKKLEKILRCASCGGALDTRVTCTSCKVSYDKGHYISYIAHKESEYDAPKEDGLFIVLKEFFKKYPAVYDVLTMLFGGLVVTRVGKDMMRMSSESAVVLNLGSGPLRVSDNTIAVDYFPYEHIDLVADITHLPIATDTVDLIVCEFVLEHAKNPEKIMQEIHRVLKPLGHAYIAVPFVAAFHSAPDDYYRWSNHGLREMVERSGLSVTSAGIVSGPTSAFLNIFVEWVAVLLSFGSRRVHSMVVVLMLIVTAPFNLLDFIFYRFSNASNVAHGIYVVSQKK